MKKAITALTASPPTGMGAVYKAWDAVSVSFDRFCLTAGIEALGTMMEQDAEQACGARHARSDGRRGHRWGRTRGKIGFHAGQVAVERPRVLIRNLAQRLERDAPGVSKSILEGLDEILTVSRLGLPAELRRSLACTNIIENMMGTVRRITRNVKRWSSSSMALRWIAAAMNEAKKGFRRLKAYKQLPALRAALAAHYAKETNNRALVQTAKAA